MSTYNAAADFYDHPVNTFWEWYGQQTVSRLRLEAGAKILDVCCGSGASAIPAAKAVGPNGFVLGIDLAENLIELAKTKARECGLVNIEFRVADMLDLDLAPSTFDVSSVSSAYFCAGYAASHPDALEAPATWRPARYHHMGTAVLRACKHSILERRAERAGQRVQSLGPDFGA
jgi:SAM-dependent methyltransferase